MKNTIHIKTLLFAGVLFFVFGCTERELVQRPADGPLKINIEWPDAILSATNHSVEGAILLMYDGNGELFQRVECGAEGYECRVPADNYTIVAVNSDYINSDIANHESCNACKMVAASHPVEEDAMQHVEHVYSTGMDNITVQNGNSVTEVTLYPENRVQYLTLNIDPNYIEAIDGLELSLTGIVPSVRAMDGSDANEETGKVISTAELQDNGNYSARMQVFGWRGENMLVADITYNDGREPQSSVPQEISDKLNELPDDGGNIDLLLELPDGGDIPLSITVEPWGSGTGSGTV